MKDVQASAWRSKKAGGRKLVFEAIYYSLRLEVFGTRNQMDQPESYELGRDCVEWLEEVSTCKHEHMLLLLFTSYVCLTN